jgi:thiamine biosynthesis lipoprotein
MRFISSLAVCFLALGCDQTRLMTGATMGTTYHIKVITSDQVEALQREVDHELARINQMMSTYIADSDLSLFNESSIGEPYPVPVELISLLRRSAQISDSTGGAFDVTVGPLVTLWGFGAKGNPLQIPDEQQIERALSRVGMQHLKMGSGSLTRSVELYVDLSAIAKGYAVDRVSELLLKKGFPQHMVEIGGELKALGNNDRNSPWLIAIEKPELLERSIFRTLPVRDLGLATSGDYRNYREVAGKRYSHLIDPRLGRPISHALASVTVLHESTATADALATALNVMSPQQGMAYAIEQSLAVLFIIKDGDGFIERRSPALDAYLGQYDD